MESDGRTVQFSADKLSAGRVEPEAQGDEALIAQLFDQCRKDPYVRIDDIESQDLPLVENETGFFPSSVH